MKVEKPEIIVSLILVENILEVVSVRSPSEAIEVFLFDKNIN